VDSCYALSRSNLKMVFYWYVHREKLSRQRR
jgi:hypothetical protein